MPRSSIRFSLDIGLCEPRLLSTSLQDGAGRCPVSDLIDLCPTVIVVDDIPLIVIDDDDTPGTSSTHVGSAVDSIRRRSLLDDVPVCLKSLPVPGQASHDTPSDPCTPQLVLGRSAGSAEAIRKRWRAWLRRFPARPWSTSEAVRSVYAFARILHGRRARGVH